eukprot:6147119-Amphidinium_carterae.1
MAYMFSSRLLGNMRKSWDGEKEHKRDNQNTKRNNATDNERTRYALSDPSPRSLAQETNSLPTQSFQVWEARPLHPESQHFSNLLSWGLCT